MNQALLLLTQQAHRDDSFFQACKYVLPPEVLKHAASVLDILVLIDEKFLYKNPSQVVDDVLPAVTTDHRHNEMFLRSCFGMFLCMVYNHHDYGDLYKNYKN